MQSALPQTLTQSQIDELRQAFELFDLNKDGRIQCCELTAVMESLRLQSTPQEIKEMIKHADIDGNGSVELNEFIDMMNQRLANIERLPVEVRRASKEIEAKQAFDVFDIDGDGLIDEHELSLTMRNLGENLTAHDIKAMIVAGDKNNDGKIDFKEFCEIMRMK